MTNKNDYVSFVLINPKRRAYRTGRDYTDAKGNLCFVEAGVDNKTGTPIHRQFRFSQGRRVLSVSKHQTDAIEFLRNHPECEGSPNCRGMVEFKELNDERSAEIAQERELFVLKVKNMVVALDETSKIEVAKLCGIIEPSAVQRDFRLIQEAGISPEKVKDIIEAPDREARSLILEGIDFGILKKRGFMIMFDKEKLGNDEDNAVRKLLNESDLFDSLKFAVNEAKK